MKKDSSDESGKAKEKTGGQEEPPLVLVLNAEPADDFEEEVKNSPALLRKLRDEGRVQVEALPQLLRVCWVPGNATESGLEDVSGLRKDYKVGNESVQGLELFALCMCMLAQDGESSANNSLLRTAQDGREIDLYVPIGDDSTASVLRDLADGRLSRENRSPGMLAFLRRHVRSLRRFSAAGFRLVELSEPPEDATEEHLLQYKQELSIQMSGDNGTRLILVRDANVRIVSALLVVGPADASAVRDLLAASLATQEKDDIADEAEDEADLVVEEMRVQISFVVRGADEVNELALEGDLELTMPPLPDNEDVRTSLARELLTRDDDAQHQARKVRAWEQLTRMLESSGLRLREPNDARVTMTRDPKRDNELDKEEKPAMMCAVVTIPAEAIRSEVARGPHLADTQPDIAHPEQREVAEELFRRAETVLLGEGISDWAKKFDKVSFVILTPNFNSLQSQTADRVTRARLGGGRVLKHTKVPHAVMGAHRQWMEEEATDPRTLLVIIADECHFAPTSSGAHDWLLNNESLTGENVLRLLVSATPQNVLSKTSRVADKNVVRWYKETSLYRSMDYYVETATWAVPNCVQPLELKVGGKIYFVDARVEVPELGHAFRYPMHEYEAFCEVLSAAARDALPDAVSQRLPNTMSFFSVIREQERLQMTMPDNVEVAENAFDAGTGLLHWLGFGTDLEATQRSRGQALADGRTSRYTVPATGTPLFCDTDANAERNGEAADCLPRRRQRVLKDEAFDEVRALVNRSFGKRGHMKRKEMKVAPSTPLFDGHIIMADYLLSLVYLSVYRVDHDDLWNSETSRADIFKALAPEDIRQLSLNVGLLTNFAQHLGFVKKLWPNLLDDPALEVGRFDIAGGVERASVQHVVDKLIEAMFETAWSELETPDVRETLRVRLGQPWIDELQRRLREDEHDTPEHWRLVWQYIISEKLTRNIEDRTNEQGNTSQTWYSETDRLMHDLLDIHPQYRTGRMAVIRVYETDENLSIQDGLRSALSKLGLASDKHGGLLSVVADVGGSDGRRSAPGAARRAARRATSLFTQLEPWALTRDLRHPSKQERAPDDSETILDRVQKSFVEAKEREELDARETEREPKRMQMTATYEDLENLPTIVILCEKGRMGDTFPHSFRFLDLRLRSSKTYSTFVQEFGRVCRYPGLDDDKTWRFEVRAISESAMQNEDSDEVDWSSLDRQLDAFFADQGAAAFFAKGGSYALLDPGNEVRFHVDSEFQLRSRLRAALQAGAQPRARFGTWIAKRYVHVLPTVLMNKGRFNAQLQQAVEHKYRDAQGHQRIDQCIPGPLDLYISRTARGNSRARPSTVRAADGKVVVTNPLHDFDAYRKCQVQAQQPDRGSIGRPAHYDGAHVGEADPRRLLLMAQCQQGKTGTYLHFVRLLKEHIELVIPAPPDPLPPVPKAGWMLPYWGDLVIGNEPPGFRALRRCYDRPQKGQYHAAVMQQRMLALLRAVERSGETWLQDFVEYLRADDGEAIQSQAGLERIRRLRSALAAAPPLVQAGGEVNIEVAFTCINFDGRFSAPEWTSANTSLLTAAIASGAQNTTIAQRIRDVRAYVQERMWDGGARGNRLRDLASDTGSSSALTFSVPLRSAYESVAARVIGSSFDDRYRFKQHIVADIELVGQGASLSAPYDGFRGLSVQADAKHAQVFLKATEEGGARTPLLDVEMAQRNHKMTRTSEADSVRWVFVPSYNRAGVALLNYDKAIPMKESGKPTVVCIVVRSGKQFDDYVAAYGSAHLILGMPPSISLDPDRTEPRVRAEHGGIGYARRFIQRAANELSLPWVWILDDNVDVCYQRQLYDDESPGSLKASPDACTFVEVMLGVEQIVHEEIEAVTALPDQKRMKDDQALIRQSEAPQAAAQGVRTKAHLTGGANKYGLIGIRRDAQARLSESKHPFMVTYSVYSFVYLNVTSTMAHGVYFPVKTFWEDVEFNHLLDEAGLVCLKVNRFFHHKKNLKLTFRNAVTRPLARLKNILERFRDECGSLTPTELMSERLVDRFPSTYRWAAEVQGWIDREGTHGARPGSLSFPVCLLERADNPVLNTLALHVPAAASAVLLVIRDEDMGAFEELANVDGERIFLRDRSGVTLYIYQETRVDGWRVYIAGTNETSPVDCEAWNAALTADQASTTGSRLLTAGVSAGSSSAASSRSGGAKRQRTRSTGPRTRPRQDDTASGSTFGRRESDASEQISQLALDSTLLSPSAPDGPPPSESQLTSNGAWSVTNAPLRRDATLPTEAPAIPREGDAGDPGTGLGSTPSPSPATLGEIPMNAANIRSTVLSVLAHYEGKDARIPPGVFAHARRMAETSGTFGDFKAEINFRILKRQLKSVSALDGKAETALRKALEALKQGLIRKLQQVGGIEDIAVPASSASEAPGPTDASSSGAGKRARARSDSSKEAESSSPISKKKVKASGASRTSRSSSQMPEPSSKEPASHAETAPETAGASSTSRSAGKDRKKPASRSSPGGAERKSVSSSSSTDAAEAISDSKNTTPRRRKDPVDLTPDMRKSAIKKFKKSVVSGRLPREFIEHIVSTIESSSSVTSQDVLDQITTTRVNESLRSVSAEHRRTDEEYKAALKELRKLLRRAFGL